MRTNPNIITSGNQMAPPQLPDVNAMMQTRTAGMENIYAIEQQRAEQQRTAQKEQEAALVEALTPAYAIAFKGGGTKEALTAAFGVLSPEFQAAIKPQFDKIMALPSDDLRMSALETSLVGSEPGRAIHASIPTAMQKLNAEIQMGQLLVAQQKLARDAAAAGRGPEPKFEIRETDIGLVRVNPQTGEVFPIAAPGAAGSGMPGPRAEPVPAPTAVAPISTQQSPNEKVLQPKAKVGSTDQTQEERRRAASVRYTVRNAERVAEIIDKNPKAFGQGADEFLLSLVPFGAGEDFMAFAQDADRQQLNYRMTQIVATLLRLETGAAYTKPELVTEAKSFMQTYGDEPETARDKLDALQDRVTSAVGSTGRAWTPEDQAQYDAAMMALETMKDKLYPVGGGSSDAGDVDTSNPLLQD